MKKIANKGTRIKRHMELQAMTEEQMHFEEDMATIQSLIGVGMKVATDVLLIISPKLIECNLCRVQESCIQASR